MLSDCIVKTKIYLLFSFLRVCDKMMAQGKSLTTTENGGIIMARSIIDQLIYSITKKPKHYVEVRNPPKTPKEKLSRPQEARQIQYNRWSKHYKMYSGSYLPDKDKNLLKKGWEDMTNTVIKNNNQTNPSKFYRRKSTNQWVRNDRSHWHWYNWWFRRMEHGKLRKQEYLYYDKYGNCCKKESKESHIKGEKEK